MDLSAYLRKQALNIPGKQQLIMLAFAKALEIIPRQICDNAGLDSTDVLNKLRMRHERGEKWAGVDVDGAEGVRDNMDAFVWEPSLVKLNAISSAAEAASLILSVDETVRNPQSEQVCVIGPADSWAYANFLRFFKPNPGPKAPPGAAARALRGRGRGGVPRR
jgi:T-complex protein 1 subunit eta